VKDTDYDELTLGNSQTVTDFVQAQNEKNSRLVGQADVIRALRAEANGLMDESFRCRALGQESAGKVKEEMGKYLLSLVASLPTKLRAQ